MGVEIRNIRDVEFADYVRVMFWAAGRPIDSAFVEERRHSTDLSGAFAAFDNGRMVATIGTRRLTMRLPGGKMVPFLALGQGGVLPGYTGRGLNRALMTYCLSAAKSDGQAMVGWTTSEWPLYERYGGGPATYATSYEIETRRAALRPELEVKGTCEVVPVEDALALLPTLHRESAERGNILVARDLQYWSAFVKRLEKGHSVDILESTGGHPRPPFCLFRSDLGSPEGVAIYRVYPVWKHGLSRTVLDLLCLVSTTDSSLIGLYRQLLSLPSVEVIQAHHRPVDEPLKWLLTDGRRLQTVSNGDHIWLRILSVERAFQSRGAGLLTRPLTVGVVDRHFGQGTKCYRLSPLGEKVEVAEVNDEPDIETDISALSSLFLGGTPMRPLVVSQRVRCKSTDALLAFSALFSEPISPYVDTEF